MMTEIWTIECGQKDVSSQEGTTFSKKKEICNTGNFFDVFAHIFTFAMDIVLLKQLHTTLFMSEVCDKLRANYPLTDSQFPE